MSFLYIYRAVNLGLCAILNFAVLGLTANWTQGSTAGGGNVLSFEGMGLFTSVITFLILPLMLVVPFFRKNAFFLYIATELVIVFLLWLFWVVTAALVIQQKGLYYPFGTCDYTDVVTAQWCNKLSAIVGLTVVEFVLLMKYMLVLTVYSSVRAYKGEKRVWFQSVLEQQMVVKLPPMTHNPGDLEAKVGMGGSSPSVSTGTYQPTNFNAPVQAPMQVINLQAQQTGRPQQMAYGPPASNGYMAPSASLPEV